MKIKKLSATFGKLKNAVLEPGDGLTVVTAPNESGKSTWCALLTAMLYGIDTSERDRVGHLSAKTRYRPWDGGSMVGTMEIENGGKDLTIQRTTKGAAPMKNLIAVYTGTAQFIRLQDPDSLGQQLTGVSRQVFERTAFIARPEMRVTQTSELEKKIAGLVSAGDENTSYTDSDELLRKWQRKLRYNKSGAIPALEQELRDVNHAYSLIASSSEEIAALRASMARTEKNIELLEEDLVTHDKLDARAAARKLAEAKKSMETAQERVDRLTGALTVDGRLMTREDTAAIRDTAAAVMPMKKVARDAEKALWRAEKELADASARRAASPLSQVAEEKAAADIQRGRELREKSLTVKEPRVPRWIPVLLCALAVIGLVLTTGLLTPLFRQDLQALKIVGLNIWGIAASLLVGAAGLVLLFIKLPHRRNAADELSDLLAEYRVSDIGKLEALRDTYAALIRDEESKRSARDTARAAYENAGNAAREAEERAVARISAFMPDVKSGEQVLEALNVTERAIDELTRAQFDAVSTRNIYETLLAGQEPDAVPEPDDTYLPIPMRNREETQAALERARAQLAEQTRALDLATGAQRTLGDPAVIEGKAMTLTGEIEELNRRYSALTLAVEALSEANVKLQTRFSPEVSRKAGEIMSRLTDGKYEKLYFDKGFDAGAKEGTSPETHNVLALSDGTADEIYLSLRLAMCELLLGGDDPCPIVLDDALANFDDRRCQNALNVLLDLSKTRQIILFSCHSREADMLEGAEGVKIIRG